MSHPERRATADRRRVPRGGRRAEDRPGCHPPVLIADAYDGAREPAARYLARFNFQVIEAADGEQTLQYIVASPPRVILADWSLPALPARRLSRWLDQSCRARHIPLIVMVGNYEPGETMPPVAGILLKPFSLAAMLDEIRRVLHASHA